MKRADDERFQIQPELNFGEGMDIYIQNGLKLASTRIPTPDNNYEKGSRIVGVCGPAAVRIPLVVTDNLLAPVGEFSVARLSLGSFVSHQEATQRLSGFFSFPVTEETPMRHLVFFEAEKFNSIPLPEQELMLTKSTDDAIVDPVLRKYFLPSIVHWTSEKMGQIGVDWKAFLRESGVITAAEYEQIKNLTSDSTGDSGVLKILGQS